MSKKEIHIGDGDRIKVERPFHWGVVLIVVFALIVVGGVTWKAIDTVNIGPDGKIPQQVVIASPTPITITLETPSITPTPTPLASVIIDLFTPTPTIFPTPTPVPTPAPTPIPVPLLSAPTELIKISPNNNPSPAFRWNAVNNATAYEVRTNSGNWMNIGNKLTYIQPTILSKGTHIFYVRAKDITGNTGPEASLNFNVSVEPDLANTKITFHSHRDGNIQIYVMNADGSGQIRLSNNSANDFDPAWSPDGSKIAFTSSRGPSGIYIMNADGSGQTWLTSGADPAWSPDGSKIAFHDGGIFVINANGSGRTRLTNNPGDDRYPIWSPDGSKIAFRSGGIDRDSRGEIYVINADASGQTRLTNNSASNRDPSFSPDGSKIAFNSSQDGNYEIYVINADGSGQTRLTNSSINDYDPHWSPDGSKIVFFNGGGSSGQIYSMNADGSGQTQLTTISLNSYPVWSPFLR